MGIGPPKPVGWPTQTCRQRSRRLCWPHLCTGFVGPSLLPPGGLDPKNTPQFVLFTVSGSGCSIAPAAGLQVHSSAGGEVGFLAQQYSVRHAAAVWVRISTSLCMSASVASCRNPL